MSEPIRILVADDHDGQTWFLGFAGPRNTTSLLGMRDTLPLRWSGEWDEAADAEFAIRTDSFGTGLVPGDMNCTITPPDCVNQPPHSGLSPDLDALAAYLGTLAVPLSPEHIRGELLSETAQRGRTLFNDPTVGCATCPTPPLYTDGLSHDVGTATADERIGPVLTLLRCWACTTAHLTFTTGAPSHSTTPSHGPAPVTSTTSAVCSRRSRFRT